MRMRSPGRPGKRTRGCVERQKTGFVGARERRQPARSADGEHDDRDGQPEHACKTTLHASVLES